VSRLVLEGLSKRYGETWAVRDVSLAIEEGEFLVLLGPSGCGKTTTLRMVAGFVEASAGEITLGARSITRVPPYRRNTGLVFQGYALFPHMTVAQNIAFGLEMRRVARPEIDRRVGEALSLVRLAGLESRFPRQLSGGQQQRVALARALVIEPEVLLLDEPLSNLDAKLRQEVRVEIRQLQQKLGLTTIMVTHDQDEAMAMADRLVVMAQGRIQQVGAQRDLYERPANRFVAEFIGRSTVLEGQLVGADRFRTPGGLEVRCRANGARPGQPATLAVRPERIRLGHGPGGEVNSFAGTIAFAGYMGPVVEYRIRLDSADLVAVEAASAEAPEGFEAGARVVVSWPVEAGYVLAAEPAGSSGNEKRRDG
jgi:putative spermidine/putrescine transport system ATP-binding protein